MTDNASQVALLEGGPCAGRTIWVSWRTQVIQVPYLPSGCRPYGEVELPCWRWWHRLLRRPVPLAPDPPTFRNLTYRRCADEPGNLFRYDPVGPSTEESGDE